MIIKKILFYREKTKPIDLKDRRKFYRFPVVFAIFYQNMLDE